MKVEAWIDEMRATLSEYRNEANAYAISKYFRNQFGSFGIKNGERRAITKLFLAEAKSFTVDELSLAIRIMWDQPEREFQHAGMELLDKYKKVFGKKIKAELEYIITRKSWWDTVDYIASHIVGWAYKEGLISKNDIYEWNNSTDMWLNRTSIIFQLKYKKETDWELLQQNILNHSGHKDFFIRKAIGWALREYGKTAPEIVTDFVDNNVLSGLSIREAMRVIKISNE